MTKPISEERAPGIIDVATQLYREYYANGRRILLRDEVKEWGPTIMGELVRLGIVEKYILVYMDPAWDDDEIDVGRWLEPELPSDDELRCIGCDAGGDFDGDVSKVAQYSLVNPRLSEDVLEAEKKKHEEARAKLQDEFEARIESLLSDAVKEKLNG